MRIGILGEKKSVLAFQTLGVETFGISNSEELKNSLQEIKSKDFAILLITEDVAQKHEKEISPLFQEILPACLVIPGVNKTIGRGKEDLKKILERALGSQTIAA